MNRNPFLHDLRSGQRAEARGELWLSRAHRVRSATAEEQRLGIDTVLEDLGLRLDWKVALSGQGGALVETVANVERLVPGWVYSSTAELIAFCDEAERFVVMVSRGLLERRAGGWLQRYGQRRQHTSRYSSVGILVPWHELAAAGGFFWLAAEPPGAEQLLALAGKEAPRG